MALGEFDLIKKYFTSFDKGEGISLGIGDDCALLDCPLGKKLAITTDTQIEGVHFFRGTSPFLIGYKSLLVNVSDLAAMGAVPYCFTLSLTLPDADENFLSEFSKGLFSLAKKLKMPLIGGNTTKGELSITICAYGLVDGDNAMKRQNAKVGDSLFVTGTLGLPGLAVEAGYKRFSMSKEDFDSCIEKSMLIEDRTEFASMISSYSKCAIDISDGLVGDLNHILKMSDVGCDLYIDKLPKPEEFSKFHVNEDLSDRLCLYGGCDYELLFTCSEENEQNIASIADTCKVKVTKIGQINNGSLNLLKHGKMHELNEKSFEHF